MSQIIAIVVTYKRVELLEKVIYALVNQTIPLDRVLIIDNNSADGTHELILNLQNKFSKLEYFNTGANLGGAGGFKFGFEQAANYSYDYIWLMDDDLLPSKNCLENLLSGNEFDIIQPLRCNLDGSLAELSPMRFDLDDFFSLSPKKQTVKQYLEGVGNKDKDFPIEGVPFEGPLISKAVVQKVGLPDSRFFIFYDDMDYSIRARKFGYRIGCKPQALATRLLLNNQSNDLSSWKGYFMLRNLFYLFFTHGNRFTSRIKPYLLATGYIILSLFKGKSKAARVCWDAIRDARDLKCNPKYIP